MLDFSIGDKIRNALPQIQLGLVQCPVEIVEEHSALWNLIDEEILAIQNKFKLEDVAKMPVIAASRKAYKILGKDPARYRLSSEALLRRVIQGKGLYKINNLVDLLNLVSIKYGFSIGGFDTRKVQGPVELGVGMKGEPYQSIGRGELNIEYLPVLRDQLGAIGTPTSDSFRTSVDLSTSEFTMVFYNFEGDAELKDAMNFAEDLLTKFANAGAIYFNVLDNK